MKNISILRQPQPKELVAVGATMVHIKDMSDGDLSDFVNYYEAAAVAQPSEFGSTERLMLDIAHCWMNHDQREAVSSWAAPGVAAFDKQAAVQDQQA